MGKLLFLRGAVPSFRPDRLEYCKINECEDVWTVLAERLSRHLGTTELWYWNAPKYRKIRVTPKFVERRIPGKFKATYNAPWRYVIARGGFKEYDHVLKNVGNAKLIYYGAGARFYPQPGMHRKYHLILVDTEKQAAKVRKIVKTGKVKGEVAVLPKPAATLFKPVDVPKDFDVCFPANPASFKGHTNMFRALSDSDLKVMCIGLRNEKLEREARAYGVHVEFVGWHRRKKLPKLYSRCKVGLVMTHGERDSCPRVIPEMTACGIPVVVADYVNISDIHINEETGFRAPILGTMKMVKKAIKARKDMNPRAYYDRKLHPDVVAEKLAKILREL